MALFMCLEILKTLKKAKDERGGGPSLLKARYRERRRDDHLVGVRKAGPLQRTAPPVPDEEERPGKP